MRANDAEQIKKWAAKWPNANVAIALGKSGKTVLDIDHGLTNMDAARAWLIRNGLPTDTYMVRTGRRPEFGLQVYFDGIMSDVGIWRLDGCEGQVKSAGGYAMAAGSVHPDSGEAYTAVVEYAEHYNAIDSLETNIAKLPDVVRALHTKQEKTDSGNPKVPKTAWTLPVHESENRTGFLMEQTGQLRNMGFGKDALLARMRELNEDPDIIADPLDETRLEQTAENQAKYLVPAPPPTVTIGHKPEPSIVVVEELEKALTALPLPAYPFSAYEGTLYMDFARIAQNGNHIPLEFLIEGAMTYVGAVVTEHLASTQYEITPRLYTVLIGPPGIGKGTTFKRIRVVIPNTRLLTHIGETAVPTCSALRCNVASENGVNDALLNHRAVILDLEELDKLFEKTGIQGSGGSLMSVIRTCFDDVEPGISTCKGREVVADYALMSLLGAITPELWRRAMEGKDPYGSGLGGRFNLVATNEKRVTHGLTKMDVEAIHEALGKRLDALDVDVLDIPTETAAFDLLGQWWRDKFKGQPHYNRINVIAHRKALHLAWIRGLPVITPEIMGHAIQLAEYLVGVREVFAVTKGEDKTAIGENRVLHILKRISPKAARSSQLVALLDGLMSRASVFRALKALEESGEIETFTLTGQTRPYKIYRASLK